MNELDIHIGDNAAEQEKQSLTNKVVAYVMVKCGNYRNSSHVVLLFAEVCDGLSLLIGTRRLAVAIFAQKGVD